MSLSRAVFNFAMGFSVVCFALSATEAQEKDMELARLRREMQTEAGNYSHLATRAILKDRELNLRRFRHLTDPQKKLCEKLKKWGEHPKLVQQMLKHDDPKVRTLAMMSLYLLEDPKYLPMISSLTDDATATFKRLHSPVTSAPLFELAHIEAPQTVGDVATAILGIYFKAAGNENFSFEEYWKPRAKRKLCASWILVKAQRATRDVSPLQPEYEKDVKQFVAELQKLPLKYRAWIQVYLKSKSFTNFDKYLSDEHCIGTLKKVGHDNIIRFLQREPVTDDPDLDFKTINSHKANVYSWMSHFILRRADQFLNAKDIPKLMECEKKQRQKSIYGVSVDWAAVSAELLAPTDLKGASAIIDQALTRFTTENQPVGSAKHARLMMSRWKINGSKKQNQIVDWCYSAQELASTGKQTGYSNGCYQFLALLREQDRKAYLPFITALIADPRFEKLEWESMKVLLRIVNDGLKKPLVTEKEIYEAWPPSAGSSKSRTAIKKWQKTLRKHFQIKGKGKKV